MSIHFSRSLRRLEADGARRSIIFLTVVASILGLWGVWFVTARIAVYATTAAARLEVDQEKHPVETPVGGRVIGTPLSAGRVVKAGEVLLELDAAPERLAQTEVQARIAPAAGQLASLKDEVEAEQRAREQELRSAQAANAENQAKVQEAITATELAFEEATRLASLQSAGLVSQIEVIRARKLADERQSAARSAEFAASRLTRDLDAREQDRLGRIARLRNEIAVLEGTRGEAAAASDRLSYEIGQRQVRAPIDGTVAETALLKVGSIVRPGDRICTIVPDGVLKVVALFEPSAALGRVRTGQQARVRLEGFPWTQYGSAPARVSNVAGELRDGQIRVELALSPNSNSAIPFQHGLPAEVDVEIERISPMVLVLRSVGSRMQLSAEAASPAVNPR